MNATADRHPWYADSIEVVEWWTDPALAYAKGLEDGARLASEQAAADFEVVLIQFLGGGRDRREAVKLAMEGLERKALRDAWYAEAMASWGAAS